MNPASARALVALAAFVLVAGTVATSLATMFLGPLLAAVLSALPAAFGRRRTRLAASVLLALSLAVAFVNHPGYRRHMERWAADARGDAPDDVAPPRSVQPIGELR
jgi:hypothetical protein